MNCQQDLAALLRKCKLLENFELQECYGLRGTFLVSIGNNLRSLDISDCFGVSGRTCVRTRFTNPVVGCVLDRRQLLGEVPREERREPDFSHPENGVPGRRGQEGPRSRDG